MEDINVQLIDMDVMIPEHVVKNHDGSYTVFINARFNQEHRLKSYTHALEHIKNGDFDRDYGDVQEIETVAHQASIISSSCSASSSYCYCRRKYQTTTKTKTTQAEPQERTICAG